MKKMTADDLDLAFHLLSKDTERYAAICDDFIRQHPDSPDGYYCRHNVWVRKRDWDKALSDLNANLILDPRAFSYIARGEVLHQAGRYAAAIEDFNRGLSGHRRRPLDAWRCRHHSGRQGRDHRGDKTPCKITNATSPARR